MYEIIPLFSGVVIGFLLTRFAPSSAVVRAAVIAVAAVVIGIFAAWVSGELAENWAFALFDGLQVVVASVLTMWLVVRYGLGSRSVRTR